MPKTAHAGFEWVPPSQVTPLPAPMQTHDDATDEMKGQGQMRAPANLYGGPSSTDAPEAMGYPLDPVAIEPVESVEGPQMSKTHDSMAGHGMNMPAPSAPNSDLAVVEGFGRDIPLALALRQIVPPGYAYAFDPGVDVAAAIDWDGGAPWDIILQNALNEAGYDVEITENKTVRIVDMGAPKMPYMAMYDPQYINKQNDPDFEHEVFANAQGVPQHTYDPAANIPATNIMPRAIDDPLAQPMARAENELLPAPHAPAKRNPHFMNDKTETGLTNPIPMILRQAPAPRLQSQPELLQPPQPQQPQNIGSAPVDLAAILAQAARYSEPLPPASIDESLEDIVPDVMVPVAAARHTMDEMSRENIRAQSYIRLQEPIPGASVYASSPGETLNPYDVRIWQAARGDNLRDVLARWSDEAGVTLYWGVNADYKLPRAIAAEGTFETAIRDTLAMYVPSEEQEEQRMKNPEPRVNRYEHTDRPIGKLHPNLPLGPSVLIVEAAKQAL